MFLSFFWGVSKHKKVIKVGTGTRRAHGTAAAVVDIQTPVEDVVIEEGDDLTPKEEDIVNALQEDKSETPFDNGQKLHNEKIVQTLKVHAIADMARRGIKITPMQNKAAIGILPKVSNLGTCNVAQLRLFFNRSLDWLAKCTTILLLVNSLQYLPKHPILSLATNKPSSIMFLHAGTLKRIVSTHMSAYGLWLHQLLEIPQTSWALSN